MKLVYGMSTNDAMDIDEIEHVITGAGLEVSHPDGAESL
jgi:hypothetical protein